MMSTAASAREQDKTELMAALTAVLPHSLQSHCRRPNFSFSTERLIFVSIELREKRE